MIKSQVNGEKMSQLPGWLWPSSNVLPPLYKQVWEAVREDRVRPGSMLGEMLVDTNKVFPLLLTSQLPTEVLGFIWSLANQKYAGQLTEQELYIVLVLVALAQMSCPFNNLDVLHLVRTPPMPSLNFATLESARAKSEPKVQALSPTTKPNPVSVQAPTSGARNPGHGSSYNNFSDSKAIPTLVDLKQNIYKPEVKYQTNLSSPDSNDEFTEFQSAPISTAQSIPNMWDSKQGSAIGSRLANHNLGVKKPHDKVKKSLNKVGNIKLVNTVAHSIETHPSELFSKCPVKTQSKTVILKDTIIRNSDSPENPRDYPTVNKTSAAKVVHSSKHSFSKESEVSQPNLMMLQPVEDKYSALRALVDEDNTSPVKVQNTDPFEETTDDFGDFVSAEQPDSAPKLIDTNVNNYVDLLSDFEFKTDSGILNSSKSSPSLIQEISEAISALGFEETFEKHKEKFDDADKINQKEDSLSIHSVEFSTPTQSVLRRSGSVPSLDLNLFLPSSQDEEQQAENMHQLIYWEWKQYMESCVLLLQVATNIFTNITSEVVLREVLASAQGYNFLCNLAEVAAVCRRVNFSHKEMEINIMGFDDLLMDIDRLWAEMEPFYTNIPIVTELPVWPIRQGDGFTCSLCLTVITSGRVIFNDNSYHASCANLWLNAVNNNLPVLRYPLSHCHSTVPHNPIHV